MEYHHKKNKKLLTKKTKNMIIISKIFNQKRKSHQDINLETLCNMRSFLQLKIIEDWQDIKNFNERISGVSKKNLKNLYNKIKRNQGTLTKIKIIINFINCGMRNTEDESNYKNILKLSSSTTMRNNLLNLLDKQINNQIIGKTKYELTNKFIAKEIDKLQNEIDKLEYLILQYNRQTKINPIDLGLDVINVLDNMAA